MLPTDEAAPAEVPVVNEQGDHEWVAVGHNLLASHDAVVAVLAVWHLATRVHKVWVQHDPVLQLGPVYVLASMGLTL